MEMEDRRRFTLEQLTVIDALINARSKAARYLASLTTLEDAVRAGNRRAFQTAEEVHKAAYQRCEALRLRLSWRGLHF
jgi:hypothetical protein